MTVWHASVGLLLLSNVNTEFNPCTSSLWMIHNKCLVTFSVSQHSVFSGWLLKQRWIDLLNLVLQSCAHFNSGNFWPHSRPPPPPSAPSTSTPLLPFSVVWEECTGVVLRLRKKRECGSVLNVTIYLGELRELSELHIFQLKTCPSSIHPLSCAP